MIKKTHPTDLPLHEQVAAMVRQWIADGRYSEGDQLPSAREIGELCGIKEQTVRRALTRLIEKGELRGAQGKGVFVSSSRNKHDRIALVVPNLEDELTLQITRGVQDTLNAVNLQTLILDAGRNSTKEALNIANLVSLPIDGAIVFPISFGNIAEYILSLKADPRPFVLIDKYLPGISADCVLADDYGGAYSLVATLADQGYRRFAWLGGEEGSSTVEERLEGFRWALGDHGIAVGRSNVRRLGLKTPTEDYRRRVAEEVDQLLARPADTRPEIIVCVNDIIALETLAILRQKGCSVPEEIAVAGFDDSKAAAEANLTSVRKPIIEMGAKAAEILLGRLSKKIAQPERIVLPATPVFRQSTERNN